MRAVQAFVGGGGEVTDLPVEAPSEGQVQLRMTHGGICGSDLHYWHEGRVGNFVIREPLTLGHEVVGLVTDDPSGTFAKGTPVGIHPAYKCMECPECLSGNPQVCRNARYLGSAASDPQTPGGYAEYLNVRLDQIRPLPEGLPLNRAVLAEPLGVALHGVTLAGDVTGKKVLVSGAGPIGLLTVGALKARGAGEVHATDMLEFPLEIARRVGADKTFKIDEEQPTSYDYDLAIECSGAPAGLSTAIDAIRRLGTVVQVGSLPGGPIPVVMATILSKEATIKGAFRFNAEIDEAIEILAKGPELEPVVTHTFGIDEIAEAMEVAHDPSRSGKVILELS